MSSIVCPACKFYLGLNATTLMVCPKCGSLLPGARDGEVIDNNEEVYTEEQRTHDLIIGGAWFLAGTLITGITYAIAAFKGEGTYLIASSPMFYGGVQFLQGLLGKTGKSKPKGPQDFCKACRFRPVEPNAERCPRCGRRDPNPVHEEAQVGCVSTCFAGLGGAAGGIFGLMQESYVMAFIFGVFGFLFGMSLISLAKLTKPFFKWMFG